MQKITLPKFSFSRFEKAFADFLQEQQPSLEPKHLFLASLVSHLYLKGHTCLDLNLLAQRNWSALSLEEDAQEFIPENLADCARTLPWKDGPSSPLVLDGDLLYLRKNWEAEQRIVKSIRSRLDQKPTEFASLEADLELLFGNDEALDQPDWQKLACAVSTRKLFTLITGGPGTGKTTTVTKLLSLLIHNQNRQDPSRKIRIALAAPTGKAAARLGASIIEAVDKLPGEFKFEIDFAPITLHKLLQIRSDDKRGELISLSFDVIVVDEASMISLALMDRLLASTLAGTRLILLGDKDQLASVEAGAVMGQLCLNAFKGNYSPNTLKWFARLSTKDLSNWGGPGSGLAQQTVMLRKSYRVEGAGVIGQWAQLINGGEKEDLLHLRKRWRELRVWSPKGDASSASCASSGPIDRLNTNEFKDLSTKEFLIYAWNNYLKLIHAMPCGSCTPCLEHEQWAKSVLEAFAEFQVICAVKEGPLGVNQLNKVIAQHLGFKDEGWYVGRPVIVTRNNYQLDLRNGDVGVCLQRNGELRVAFPQDGSSQNAPVRWILPARIDSVESVFALTVHKSQGSEFNHICFVLPAQRQAVMTRELIYTGLTRAKKHVTWAVPNEVELFKSVEKKLSRSGGLYAVHDLLKA